MKQVTYTILVLILFATNLHAQKTAPLNDVLKEVAEVLKEVEINSGIPKPKKVSVSFQTEASTEIGGGVKILIFKFGRKCLKLNQVK